MTIRAVLFDFSGTLFRLEEDDGWFAGIEVDDRAVGQSAQAELMRRLTQPTGDSVEMDAEVKQAWIDRDLEPRLHRLANLHVLRQSGLRADHAEALYARAVDPDCWTPYPDTGPVLAGLRRAGVRTAVVSNISFDLRPAFARIGALHDVDEFVLSFEVGAIKPSPEIFHTALRRLGVTAAEALMIGDSEEADGGARAIGCQFALVDALPTRQRRDGLLAATRAAGLAV